MDNYLVIALSPQVCGCSHCTSESSYGQTQCRLGTWKSGNRNRTWRLPATADDQIMSTFFCPRRTLRSDRGGYQGSVAQGQGAQVFRIGWPRLAVPLTSEKGCLGNMVNSMLRHICGQIYDIIRHNTTYCCILLSSTPLRCPLCILCSRTAHRRTRAQHAQRPSPRECVNTPRIRRIRRLHDIQRYPTYHLD